MKPNLILLFNHTLTEVQRRDAYDSLGVGSIVYPPQTVQQCWENIPPDNEDLNVYLAPVLEWLASEGRQGDYVLVQGEFGATCLLVRRCFALGLIPTYSTTRRQAVEQHHDDGTVQIRHTFSHVRFRRYSP